MLEKKNQKEDPEQKIETAIDNTEIFIRKNGKVLLIVLGAVFLIVCAYFGAKYLYSMPREENASAMMFGAQQRFQVDSFDVALNGGNGYAGFLEVIDTYGSTNAGNIANHYAGICYLKQGDYQNAIKYLGKYSHTKGIASEVINAQNYGLMGDVNVQLGNLQEAVKMFEKAVEATDNDFTAPYYLKKLGMVNEKLNNKAQALKAYERILNEYPTSFEGRDIEKYIGRLAQN